MTQEINRKEAITELKEVCQEIGCSGLDPDMCQNKPHLCKIIRRMVNGSTGNQPQAA